MSMPTLKRPKPGDDEEELLCMQEEFLKSKQEPSAKVIDLRGQNKTHTNVSAPAEIQREAGRVRSRFSELKKLKTQDRYSVSQVSGEVINPMIKEKVCETSQGKPQDLVQNIPITPPKIILGNIIEKRHTNKRYEFNSNQRMYSDSSGTGFPEVFVSDHINNDSKQSLFWQKVLKERVPISQPVDNKRNEHLHAVNDENSILIEGSWAQEIHKANLEKLNQMSQEEILREKSKLEASLSPEIIQFLKNKKSRTKQAVDKSQQLPNPQVKGEPMEISKETDDQENKKSKDNNEVPMECDEGKIDVAKSPVKIMKQAKEKGWVHMDSLEPEKLKWMEDIPAERIDEPVPDEPYNARFDFNGLLLPFKDENLTVDKGLHHHGEEPERPGYSLQELLQLSRSSTQQQRCTALNTLANIVEKSRKGWYDKTLHPAPLVALSQKNILLLLRFSLDDTSIAVITATLQALRAFLYSEADEVCLDRLYGWDKYKEAVLMPPPNDVTDTSDLKDHELVQLDAVAALLRSDIVLRIRYILSEIHPPPIGVICGLEILIRLARHSHTTALNIACVPNLLDIIVHNFMPLSTHQLAMCDTINNAYDTPVVSAIKLCRVLINYGGTAVAQRLDKLKVIPIILSYINSDAGKESIHISIESLRLWKMLLVHGIAKDSVSGAQLNLVSQLQLLLSNHDIQSTTELACEHAALLITVASYKKSLKQNISVLLSKWTTQLPLVSSPTWAITKLIAQSLLAADNISAFKTGSLLKSSIFSTLCSTSNLLSGYTLANDREPSSLPNFDVLTHNGELQPIVSQHSCIPFLATVLNVFYERDLTADIQMIFEQPDFCKYLQKLETTTWSLERSWYTRTEFSLLTSAVKAASLLRERLNNKIAHIIWKITIKLISALPADSPQDVKDMINIALSNEKLNLEVISSELAKLNLGTSNEGIKIDLSHDVASLYKQYVNSSEEWNQAAMPKDWLYLPLVHIYTKCKNNGTCEDEDKKNILVLLGLELVIPDFVERLSVSLRFSRLILVYLCDTVYLDKDVSVLITRVISNLLEKSHRKLNFTKDLPGLNSFVDLFTSICEHFCSTSYGDDGFSMILLTAIAQRHDVHYRKLLWSEQAGALRYIKLTLEKLMIPLKEYLYPLEEDTSLIESYLTALVRGNVKREWCTIPYTIAVHHSAMYLKRSDKLAIRMRTQIEKLPNKSLANTLLSYEPPAC